MKRFASSSEWCSICTLEIRTIENKTAIQWDAIQQHIDSGSFSHLHQHFLYHQTIHHTILPNNSNELLTMTQGDFTKIEVAYPLVKTCSSLKQQVDFPIFQGHRIKISS